MDLTHGFVGRELAIVLNGIGLDILQVERRGHDGAVPAQTLGLVERGIGLSHQCGLIESLFSA